MKKLNNLKFELLELVSSARLKNLDILIWRLIVVCKKSEKIKKSILQISPLLIENIQILAIKDFKTVFKVLEEQNRDIYKNKLVVFNRFSKNTNTNIVYCISTEKRVLGSLTQTVQIYNIAFKQYLYTNLFKAILLVKKSCIYLTTKKYK